MSKKSGRLERPPDRGSPAVDERLFTRDSVGRHLGEGMEKAQRLQGKLMPKEDGPFKATQLVEEGMNV